MEELTAALLDAPILGELISPMDALEVAVSSARYWHEPEGEDALAAHPTIQPALQRAAAALLRCQGTGWWDEPVAPSEQWAVDFGDKNSPRAGGPDIRTFRAHAVAEEERARVDRPAYPAYSFSGTWWSTPLVPLASFSTTRRVGEAGPIGLYLVEDSMGWQDAVARPVRIDPSANV